MSFIVLDPFNVQSLPFMCNSGRKQNLYANEKKYIVNKGCVRVLIKQPAKKMVMLRYEPSSFGEKWVKWGSESLKLPSTLDCQAADFYILEVYFKTKWEPCCVH